MESSAFLWSERFSKDSTQSNRIKDFRSSVESRAGCRFRFLATNCRVFSQKSHQELYHFHMIIEVPRPKATFTHIMLSIEEISGSK